MSTTTRVPSSRIRFKGGGALGVGIPPHREEERQGSAPGRYTSRPGEVYRVDFEEMEPHPIIIMSREGLNRGHWVTAVLIASTRFTERSKQPHCVAFRAGQF